MITKTKLFQRGKYFNNDSINLNKFDRTYDSFNFVEFFTGYADVSFALDKNNNAYACGKNTEYMLGLGKDTKTVKTFTKLPISNVKMIAIGTNHTLLLTNDGFVYAAGRNDKNQFGIGELPDTIYYKFTKLPLQNVKYIACGEGSSYYIDNDNLAYSCGNNNYGQLGLGTNADIKDTLNRNTFTKINIDNVKSICISLYSAYIIKNDNTCYSCGSNGTGQLGLGDNNNRDIFTKINIDNVKKISVGSNHTALLKDNNELYFTGYNSNGEYGDNTIISKNIFTLSNEKNILDVNCSSNHTFILKNDGILYSTGYNKYGESLIDNKYDIINTITYTKVTDNIKSIHSSKQHSFLIDKDNNILVGGLNNFNQLGCFFNEMIIYSPTKFNFHNTDNIKNIFKYKDKIMLTKDSCEIQNVKLYDNFHDYKQILLTEYTMFILLNNGNLYSCGYNINGQLGLGDTKNRSIFCKVPIDNVKEVYSDRLGYTTFIIKNDGSVWSCGLNTSGQLGIGDKLNKNLFQFVNVSNIQQICIESNYTMILTTEGTLLGSGNNSYVLKNNNVSIFTNQMDNLNIKIKKIASYDNNFYLIEDSTNYLYVKGLNNYYELGTGNTATQSSFTKVPSLYYSNSSMVCAIKDVIPVYKGCVIININNRMFTTGYSYMDYTASNSDNTSSTKCYRFGTRRGNSSTNVDYSSSFFEDYSRTGNQYDSKFLSNNAIGLIKAKDSTNYWGCFFEADYYDSILTADNIAVLNYFILYSDSSGLKIRPSQYNKLNYGYIESYPIKNVKDIISTQNSSIIIDSNNNIYCIGINYFNKFGIGNTGQHTNTNRLVNITDQYNSYITMDEIKKIETSDYATFILKKDGSLFSCGYNEYGQLGLGDTINKNEFTQVPIDDVKDIIISSATSFVIKNDNTIYSCGKNDKGQLGLNDTNNRNIFTEIDTSFNTSPIKKISCAPSNSFLLFENGLVYCCGDNTHGQLGIGTFGNNENKLKFALININDIRDLYCSSSILAVINNNNELYMCGDNTYGQIGMGTQTRQLTLIKKGQNIKEVIIAGLNTFIISYQNTCSVTGKNSNKCLGLDMNSTITTFNELSLQNVKKIVCNSNTTLFLTQDNKLYSAGHKNYGSTHANSTYTLIKENVKDIFNDSECCYYIDMNNNLFGSGTNSFGQLGQCSTGVIASYIKIRSNVKILYTNAYSIYIQKNTNDFEVCGSNTKGQLGIGNTYEGRYNNYNYCTEPVPLPFVIGDIIDIKKEYNYLLINNKVIVPTDTDINYSNIFGDTYIEYEYISLPFDNIKEVAISRTHVIVLLENGEVYGCGSNEYGELFKELTVKRYDNFTKLDITHIKHIACGNNFTYYIDSIDNSLKCIGKNTNYELGLGHNEAVNTVQTISSVTNLKDIKITNNYILALTENNILFAQGLNINCCFGLGLDTKDVVYKLFVKIANNIKELTQIDDNNIFYIDNNNNLQVAGKNTPAFHIDDALYYISSFSPIPLDEIDNIIDILSTEETLYIISRISSEDTNIELVDKTLNSVKVNIQDVNNDITKVEMIINGESIETLSKTSVDSIIFNIPKDKLKIGSNRIMFKAYSKYENLYDTMFIYKESTGNENIIGSSVLINNKIYKISDVIDQDIDDVIIVLDRGLENELKSEDTISILLNNIKVQVRTNKTGLFKDTLLKEIKKVDSGYQEIYEFEESNMSMVQPKVIVEKGDKWTSIKRPSIFLSYDPLQFQQN
ncbi:TPA: chromosome condensation regulator [Clostridioides difficile]|nr:chromosome condensation regulator [Clostridioides difficile]